MSAVLAWRAHHHDASDPHLAELACRLDAAYRQVAARLPDNAALELVRDGERINLDRLHAEPEPPSLVQLRKLLLDTRNEK